MYRIQFARVCVCARPCEHVGVSGCVRACALWLTYVVRMFRQTIHYEMEAQL